MMQKLWSFVLMILFIAVCSTAYSAEKIRVLNPTPPNRMVDRVPLTPRLDTLEGKHPSDLRVQKMLDETNHLQKRRKDKELAEDSFVVDPQLSPNAAILGLAWRDGDKIVINPDRPFIPDLNDLVHIIKCSR